MKWSVIGPLEGKLTGQSRVTSEVVRVLTSEQYLSHKINTNFEGCTLYRRIARTLISFFDFLTTIMGSFGYYISIKRGGLSALVDFIYVVIAKGFKKKIVIHLHGNEIFSPLESGSYLSFNFAILNMRLADLVICLNTFQAVELKKIGINQVRVIPNFTEFNVENKKTRNLVLETKEIRITYLSNFMKEKGFFKYLGLFKSFPHIQFSLCGSFLSDDSLERQSFDEDYIVSLDNVEYHGFVKGDLKQDILCNSHFIFFVSTYSTEAQPLSLLEAMSFGCVPIVANRPYISDIVTSENGIVLSADPDIYEIRDAIRSLPVENYAALSKKCRMKATSFSLIAFEEKLLELFHEFT